MNQVRKDSSDNKWNLLFSIQSLSGGGAELVIENLCKHVNSDLFKVSVCHFRERGERGDELLKLGYDVFGVSKSHLLRVDYLTFLKLRKIIRQKDIDIIHTHNTHSLADASLCKLMIKGLKLIHTFHFGNYPFYSKKGLFLEKVFWRIPDKLIAVGNEQRKMIQKTHKIPDHRIITILNCVKNREANVDQQIFEQFGKSNKLIIGSMSTLSEQKGLTYSLDVAHSLKRKRNDFVFLIVGDGPLRTELELKCQTLNLEDTVFFLGWASNGASRVLPIFDIFFQPSLWEAMSMVVLEAMAAGKPIVATKVGENGVIIEDGKEGMLVEPKNVDQMLNALEFLMDNSDKRIEMGNKAKDKAVEFFNIEKMVKQYERLYLEVLSGQR